jgi:putative transcriptional regulator
MAIAIKLDDLLHDRRMTLTELADRIGMTLANLSILKTGKARAIRFSTLNAICGALSCQPGDILRFESDAEREPASNKRISNETHRHTQHHVSALDAPDDVSPFGRRRPRDGPGRDG